jgi:hypothetical protein
MAGRRRRVTTYLRPVTPTEIAIPPQRALQPHTAVASAPVSAAPFGAAETPLPSLTWAALSRFIGAQTGWRVSCYSLARVLAGVAATDFRRADGSVDPAFDPSLARLGWPNGRKAMKRAAIEPAALDKQWSTAHALDGAHAVLPLELVRLFFPEALWPVASAIIAWGPAESQERIERWMRLCAAGHAADGRQVSAQTLGAWKQAGRRFLKTVKWFHDSGAPSPLFQGAPVLNRWAVLPAPIRIDAAWGAPTTKRAGKAPTAQEVRGVLHSLDKAGGRARENGARPVPRSAQAASRRAPDRALRPYGRPCGVCLDPPRSRLRP